MAAFGRDASGNPMVITADVIAQELYSYITGGSPEIHNNQPGAAGDASITFTRKVNSVIVSSTVDVYVAFDATSVSATTGFLVPAKMPVTFPMGCTKLNVYATAAGTVTAIGKF